jgi:hypothetical protein
MKTRVIMKRELFNYEISQDSKTGYFSATDLVKAGNAWRVSNDKEMFNLKNWVHTKGTQEFIKELEGVYGQAKINSKGKNSHTWVHPYLFIDLALAISPKLKLEVYSWLKDELLKYRNDSGDSYKKMTGALYISISNKSNFKNVIASVASRIKKECEVTGWETATEKQLKLRDKIHEYIALLSDILKDLDNLLDISIERAKKEIK